MNAPATKEQSYLIDKIVKKDNKSTDNPSTISHIGIDISPEQSFLNTIPTYKFKIGEIRKTIIMMNPTRKLSLSYFQKK